LDGSITLEIKLADRNEPGGHLHVIVMNDEANEQGLIGLTSSSDGHIHPVVVIPEQQQIVDPNTGQIVQPYTPQSIQVLPNTEDGHTHEIKMIPIPERKGFSDKDKEFYRATAVDLYKQAKALDEEGFISTARVCDEFFKGNQWDSDIANKRRAEGKTVLTIDSLTHLVNVLVGFYIQNQTDIVYKPTEEGDELKADLLNEVVKIICEHSDFNDQVIEAAYDQIIAGRGNFEVSIDTVENPEGDIVISHAPYDTVFYGAHKQKNLKDCQCVAREKWYSKVELRSKLPREDRNKINQLRFFSFDAEYDTNDDPTTTINGMYLRGDSIYMKGKEWIDEQAKKVKVISVQFKIYETDDFILHESGFVYHVDSNLPDDIKQGLFTLPGFDSFEKDREKTILAEVSCEDILLRLIETPGDMITAAAAYATKRGKTVIGKVAKVLDLCREKNYIRSKMTDIIRTMNGKGYYITSETFASQDQKDNFVQNVGREGFICEVSSLANVPLKEEGVGYPVELANQIAMIDKEIGDIMGVNPELLGFSGDSTSNIMIQTKQNSALLGSQYLFEGMSIAKRRIGKIILRLLPYIMTGERVWRMVKNKNKKIPVVIGNKNLADYSQKEIQDIWDGVLNSNYDVTVAEAPYSNTKRERDFQVFAGLASQQVLGIDGRMLISMSNLPPQLKAQSLQYAEESASAANAIQEKRLGIETEKTQVAAQSRESVALAQLQQKDRIDTMELQLKAIELGQKAGSA
jgi:hypothetical protein